MGHVHGLRTELGRGRSGARREKDVLLIVVADHGISGLGSPMQDLVGPQSHVAVTEERVSATNNIFSFSLPFSDHFLHPSFEGRPSVGYGSNTLLTSSLPPPHEASRFLRVCTLPREGSFGAGTAAGAEQSTKVGDKRQRGGAWHGQGLRLMSCALIYVHRADAGCRGRTTWATGKTVCAA